ncbi:MAG: hypothetical protein A3K77_00700 [Euryarchaeota archaeon RBG_13_31_8]|nr:MAG: hypothetical protein A3K77_00700 [Euryarchaeota archaeon RBG_13_31_8]
MAYQLMNQNKEPVKYNGKDVLGADFLSVIKDVDMNARTLILRGTDETKDRSGDIILLNGWDFKNYRKNPVFLWAHDYSSIPIAGAKKVTKIKNDGCYFEMKFPTLGLYPFADMILSLYNERIIRASSVGFIPFEWEDIKEEDSKNEGKLRYLGRKFLKQELLELSGCAVPCNPNAVQDMVKSIKRGEELFKMFQGDIMPEIKNRDDVLAELDLKCIIIDKENKSFQVGIDLENKSQDTEEIIIVQDIKSDSTGFIPLQETEEKEICGDKGLELADEGNEWDVKKAELSVRKWASSDNSGDKDTIDFNKYKKAFCWRDAQDKESLTAYKLPFAMVMDNKLKAVWRGVASAMAAILGARGGVDIPDEDRKRSYNLLASYYKKFDKEPPDYKSFDDVLSKALENIKSIIGVDNIFDISTMSIKEVQLKAGAVLNKKNRENLKNAQGLIQRVIDSAEKPEEEDESSKDSNVQDDNKNIEPIQIVNGQSNGSKGATVFDVILTDSIKNNITSSNKESSNKESSNESLVALNQSIKNLITILNENKRV